jgi:UDP-glucose 4-epimerase
MAGSVLVTGGNGLIGQATLAKLAPSARLFAIFRKTPEASLPGDAIPVVHDLRAGRDPDLPEIPDTIIHLAQSPLYGDFPDGALDVFEVNIASTQRLLDWARRSGVRRFVYASSGSLYGRGTTAFAEDTTIDDCSNLGHYPASKRCAELLCWAYQSHMAIIVLRFFFVYGPGQRRTMLIPRLVENVRHDRPVMLQGDQGMRFNPIFADDAGAAVAAAASLDGSETINVAGPEILSLRDVGLQIGEAVGREPRFETQPCTVVPDLIGSTGKMARLLGPPRIAFREGIRELVATDMFRDKPHGAG